jgi:hypothetical protein
MQSQWAFQPSSTTSDAHQAQAKQADALNPMTYCINAAKSQT